MAVQTEQGQRLQMTYEEYLAWAHDDIRAEWVNGEVIVETPPKPLHQRVVGFLHQLLGLFTQLFRLGELLPAPWKCAPLPRDPRGSPTCFLSLGSISTASPRSA